MLKTEPFPGPTGSLAKCEEKEPGTVAAGSFFTKNLKLITYN
jgi:hypothetical protein